MNKLMLEALAAWLALAIASGQAAAAISATGAQIDSLPTIVSHGNGISDDSRFAAPPFLSNGAGLSPDPSIGAAANTLFLLPVPGPGAAPEGVTTRAAKDAAKERVAGRNSVVALLTQTATDRSGTRSTKPAKSLFGIVDAPRSSGAPHDLVVGDLRGGLVRANVVSGQSKAIQTVGLEGPEASKINLAAGAKLVPATMVSFPEPGSWATLLAGLLGVIAIGRRRISL